MSANLNHPAILPGPLHAADFDHTEPSAPAPAEAATDIGYEHDDDGGEWFAAPLTEALFPLLPLVLVAIAATIGVFLGPDVASWLSAR